MANQQGEDRDEPNPHDDVKAMGQLAKRRNVVRDQLAVMDAFSHKRDDAARGANVHEDDKRALDGEEDDELGVIDGGKPAYAEQPKEKISGKGDSLGSKEPPEGAQLGGRERD